MEKAVEAGQDDVGLGVIRLSGAVPKMVLARVMAPARNGPKPIGERIRQIHSKNLPFTPPEFERQRLYAGFLEPHPSGMVNEAILPPPSSEAGAGDEWRYILFDWAVLCFRPRYLGIYAVLHADISFGLRENRVIWQKIANSYCPIASLSPMADDGFLLGWNEPGKGDQLFFAEHKIRLKSGEITIDKHKRERTSPLYRRA